MLLATMVFVLLDGCVVVIQVKRRRRLIEHTQQYTLLKEQKTVDCSTKRTTRIGFVLVEKFANQWSKIFTREKQMSINLNNEKVSLDKR